VKLLFLAVAVLIVFIVVYGSPITQEKPLRAHYFGSPEVILPMNFAHNDHTPVNCIDCHHNYTDDTGDDLCMHCHVSNNEVWPLLETQFHDFCRGCHTEKSALGEDGGPPRQCMACHLGDDLP